MLRNISGAHIQLITDDSKKLFYAPAGSLKICHGAYSEDLVRAFHDRNLYSPIACRKVDDTGSLSDMLVKTREALEFFRPLIRIAREKIYIEIWPNEKFTEGDELRQLSENTVECARIIFEAGARPIGFNLPVANPANIADCALMQEGAEALIRYHGLVGYHNYTIPTLQLNKFLDLRHEAMSVYLPLGTQFALNEGLFDHGIIDGHLAGWRYDRFSIDVDFTARYVRDIAQRLSLDRRVKLWTPFGAGAASDWHTFSYDSEPKITGILQEQYDVHPDYVLGEGFRRMIAFLGSPIENEIYHFPGSPMETSLTVFTNGSAMWHKITNETVGVRNDGAIFTDRGNLGDGTVKQVWP